MTFGQHRAHSVPSDQHPVEGVREGVQQLRRGLKYISDEKVEYVDIRFCDLPGVMQHLTVPASAFDQNFIDGGIAFDGSSVRGFQAINESDMALFPDPADRAARTRSASTRR